MFTRVGDRFPVSQEALERALWRMFERTLEPYQIAEDIPDSHLRNLMLPDCLGRPVGLLESREKGAANKRSEKTKEQKKKVFGRWWLVVR
jgi:hypothetical protein